MNFDELRNAWANEPIQGAALPASLSTKTHSSISRIRKNMRNEFIWTLIALGATFIFVLFQARTHVSFLVACTASFLLVQTGYYFWRFFLFYRRAAGNDMNLKKNIRQFAYELELNMEIYKTYSFCVTPVACLLWIAIMDATGRMGFLQSFLCSGTTLGIGTVAWAVLVLLSAQVIVAFFLRLHLRMQYGRYLIELRRIVTELERD